MVKSKSAYSVPTKKGKLDRHPIWIVKISMPKSLMFDMYKGYLRSIDEDLYGDMEQAVTQPNINPEAGSDMESADDLAEI